MDGSQWLVSNATWDGSDNLVAVLAPNIDPHTNLPAETDMGYDANGNMIWAQGPWLATGSEGTGRPMARYAYDQYNNLVASCDPQYIWTSGAATCAPALGVI